VARRPASVTEIIGMEVARKKPSVHRAISTDLPDFYVMAISLTTSGAARKAACSPRADQPLVICILIDAPLDPIH
jgi:hypothetical protein